MTEIKINKKMVYLSDHLADLASSLADADKMEAKSTGQIVWHKWPEEKPPFEGRFLVTEKIGEDKPFVSVLRFETDPRFSSFGILFEKTEILAWAELPEPYNPD